MLRSALIVVVSLCLVPTVLAAPVDGVRVEKDVDYVAGADYADGKDRLDLYLPEGRTNYPVLVFFHGGGLRNGDKSGSGHIGMAFAAEGVGVAVANYRLSPTVAHPEHAEDAARAIAWVKKNIATRGGNPEKVFMTGHSAGGYLSGLLVVDPRYLKTQDLSPNDLAGSIPISGFFYVHEIAADRPKDVWGEEERGWKNASPSSYVRGDAIPMLFVYADGDADWRREQNERFAAELSAKGSNDIDTVEIADRDHNGIVGSIAAGDATVEAILAFVQSH